MFRNFLQPILFLKRTFPLFFSILLLIGMGMMFKDVIQNWKHSSVDAILLSHYPTQTVYFDVAGQHLFGHYLANLANLPMTHLPLKLQGTIVNQKQAQNSIALIQFSGKTKLYSVGDRLPGGAQIDRILQQRVILKRNGHLESLP